MAEYIHQKKSSVTVFTVFYGRQIPETTVKYRAQIPAINIFDPDYTIIHMGHNDLAKHPYYNPRPLVSRDVSRMTINFARTEIFLSSVFPRTFTETSNLSETQVVKYNQTAKRHGQRLRTRATEVGYNCILTSILWQSISSATADPDHYLPDGLHLSVDGSKHIATEWLVATKQITIIPPNQ
jgi:lysophospholipase L1-like esterase